MRGTLRRSVAQTFVLSLLAATVVLPARGQTVSQSAVLQPGWNAVFLEVQPADPSPAAVFAGLPVSSVWTHAERLSSANFIQNASEEVFNTAGWLSWFPPQSREAFLGNLYAVNANHTYLLKSTSAAPVNWTVTGTPTARGAGWVTDAYTLRSFAVPASSPPTFGDFFQASPAHFDSSSGQLQNIYRLGANGQWALAAPTDRMRRGEAVWVFTKGASDYEGPVEVQPELGDSVDFDTVSEQQKLEVQNRTTSAQTVTLALRNATASGALVYRVFEPANGGYVWRSFPAQHTINVPPNSIERLLLGIRRGAFNEAYSASLEVTHPAQNRFIPVYARHPATDPGKPSHPMQGLWVGVASVSAVNEVNRSPTNVTPVQAEFPLRVLVHVDGTGKARFLKEVLQMWRDGTYTNDANGTRVLDKPGQQVLLTDDRLLGQFKGATLRDGVPVGRRISTAGFDFDGGTSNYLAMDGTFAVNNRLTLSISLPPNSPANPFRHKYHPDHDNLDGRFVPLTNNFEAYPIRRDVEFHFSGTDPTGGTSPNFGYSVMGGAYRETLNGLHKEPIRLQGTFQLTRACPTGELNPSPRP